MDEQLKNELKKLGLFPLELDPEAQEMYKALGIDPSRIEVHYTPGTPKPMIDRYERITKNVLVLHGMESKGKNETQEYMDIEESIRTDLFEIYYPTAEDVLFKLVSKRPITGIIGIYRDTAA